MEGTLNILTVSPVIVGPGTEALVEFWASDANSGDILTFAAPGAPAGSVVNNLDGRRGEFTSTPSAAFEDTTNVINITVFDGTDTDTGAVDVVVLPATLANLIINELHADPAAGIAGDANGDGVRDAREDEFVELYNRNATADIDVSNWILRVGANDLFTFPAGTIWAAETVLVPTGNGTATLTYTGQVADEGTLFTITVTADDGMATDSADFTLNVTALAYAGLIINEFMPDPDVGATHVDSNNDGVNDIRDDEFIEIVNNNIIPVDLVGVQLADANDVSHVFSSYILPVGGSIVVFGGGSFVNFTNGPAVRPNNGNLLLTNTGDTVRLLDPATNLIDSVTYADPGAGGQHPLLHRECLRAERGSCHPHRYGPPRGQCLLHAEQRHQHRQRSVRVHSRQLPDRGFHRELLRIWWESRASTAAAT